MSKYDLDFDYAIPKIDISAEELNEIIAEADSIIADNNTSPEKLAVAYLKKAQCLQKIRPDIENFKETQCQVKEIIEKVMKLSTNMPEALMQMGKWYYINGNFNEAINMYTMAIKLKPDYAAAFNNRSIAYSSTELIKAIADSTEAIRIRPFDAIYYFNRGKKYSALGEHEKAIADFSESIRLRPDQTQTLLLRGLSYLSTGNEDKAKMDFDEVLHRKRETD
jgi:tetratricopeptide (TPR) repeat protein